MRGDNRRYLFALVFAVNVLFSVAQPGYTITNAQQYPRLVEIPLQPVETNSKHNDTKLFVATLFVYVFMSPECPLCKHYLPQLKKLQDQFAGRILIKGVFPGVAYTADTLANFSREYDINFPLFIDSAKLLSAYLGASVTPEVMVFTKNNERIYSGAVDDWLNDLGEMRVKASRLYLQDAIAASLLGQKVKVPHTTAKGCLINDF